MLRAVDVHKKYELVVQQRRRDHRSDYMFSKFACQLHCHMGHIVNIEVGYQYDPEKVARTPNDGLKLRSFLVLASYCRKFIPEFGRIAATWDGWIYR